MTTTLKESTAIIVGDEYAKVLGYEELVGAMGIIDDVMNAMCGIFILSGNKDYIGKKVDVHKADCLLQVTKEESYHVLIEAHQGFILYTKDKDFLDYITHNQYSSNRNVKINNIKHVHEAIDFCEKDSTLIEFRNGRQKYEKNFDWLPMDLDETTNPHPVAAGLQRNYQQKVARDKERAETVKVNESLTESFRSQLISKKIKEKADDFDIQVQSDESPYSPSKPMGDENGGYHDY